MNTQMLKLVRRLYDNRNYQRQWVRSIRRLGARWLLAVNVQRQN
jgi:hypothetical protein